MMANSVERTCGVLPLAACVAPVAPHHYPLSVRKPSFVVAIGLLMRSMPYALARFCVLLATSIAVLIWLIVMFGGASWLGTHITPVFAWLWIISCLTGGGFFWGTVVRYLLHLIECGHVAVLTELVTKGSIGNVGESQFAYGKRVVSARFTEANVLFGLNSLVRGIVNTFHRTLDWISELIPMPGLESVASVINLILKAATRYVDKVIFSYTLARGDDDPWRSSREGIIYYAQNAKPILKTAAWSVILERTMSLVMWAVLLLPAALITLALPAPLRGPGGFMTVLVALLLASSLRGAFIKPLFLIMMMVRFHAEVEGQAINPVWDERLSRMSDKFRELGQIAANAIAQPRWTTLWR